MVACLGVPGREPYVAALGDKHGSVGASLGDPCNELAILVSEGINLVEKST